MKAFMKKEWMEMTRTGRLLILSIIFILFGIMNPAIAKLTPWMMEMMQESIAESGLSIGEVTVNAMTSWGQFYKNTPMAVLVMVLMCSGILTNEYQSGTLVQVVTKGLPRWKVLLSKMVVVYGTWTVLYFAYFGITYGYTAYFWGEDHVEHLMIGVLAYWLFGMLILSLVLLFSTMASSSGQVLMGTGGVFMGMVFLNYIPKLKTFLPLRLQEGLQVSVGNLEPKDLSSAGIFAGICIVICAIMGWRAFNERRL